MLTFAPSNPRGCAFRSSERARRLGEGVGSGCNTVARAPSGRRASCCRPFLRRPPPVHLTTLVYTLPRVAYLDINHFRCVGTRFEPPPDRMQPLGSRNGHRLTGSVRTHTVEPSADCSVRCRAPPLSAALRPFGMCAVSALISFVRGPNACIPRAGTPLDPPLARRSQSPIQLCDRRERPLRAADARGVAHAGQRICASRGRFTGKCLFRRVPTHRSLSDAPYASPLAAPSGPSSSAVENATGRTVLRHRCCRTRGASETRFHEPPTSYTTPFSARSRLLTMSRQQKRDGCAHRGMPMAALVPLLLFSALFF